TRYTWNTEKRVWKKHGDNKSRVADTINGVKTRSARSKANKGTEGEGEEGEFEGEKRRGTQKNKRTRNRKKDQEGDGESEDQQRPAKRLTQESTTPSKASTSAEGESSKSNQHRTEDWTLWDDVFATFHRQHIPHPMVRKEALEALELLRDLPLNRPEDPTPNTSHLIVKAPDSIQNHPFDTEYIWDDIEYAGLDKVNLVSRGLTAYGSRVIASISANWSADADSLVEDDPHFNFIDVRYTSPNGMKVLNIRWKDFTDLITTDPIGSATFTQAGNITFPHMDGHGNTQRASQQKGDKVWIVWPPSRENVVQVDAWYPTIPGQFLRDRHFSLWLQKLKNPEVFYIKAGDSFTVLPGTIHACISVTQSVHHGIFHWNRSSFGLARELGELFQEAWQSFLQQVGEQIEQRDAEDQ
ncbi:hypothetical protein BT96DRAFT_952095, partial [Gymnopus androsaceus JB14]